MLSDLGGGYFVVQLFDFVAGDPSSRHVVHIERMVANGWEFYESDAEMRERWERYHARGLLTEMRQTEHHLAAEGRGLRGIGNQPSFASVSDYLNYQRSLVEKTSAGQHPADALRRAAARMEAKASVEALRATEKPEDDGKDGD